MQPREQPTCDGKRITPGELYPTVVPRQNDSLRGFGVVHAGPPQPAGCVWLDPQRRISRSIVSVVKVPSCASRTLRDRCPVRPRC